MKKTLYTILLSAILLGALSVFPTKALADCQAIYGGGQNCTYNFSINKLVQVPGKGGGSYVDNLYGDGPKYAPSQNVNFQVVVKNTGSVTIPSLNVVDSFPLFVSFVSGPGNFDTNTLSFYVTNLAAGQSSTYTITGKVADLNSLQANQTTVCLLNQVTGTDSNGVSNSDSSQFCVLKNAKAVAPVLPVTKIVTTPATGPEMLPLIGIISGAFGGFILRKKSKNDFKGGEK